MPINPFNPVVVQSDHTVLLEVDNPSYAEARDELATSPEHIYEILSHDDQPSDDPERDHAVW